METYERYIGVTKKFEPEIIILPNEILFLFHQNTSSLACVADSERNNTEKPPFCRLVWIVKHSLTFSNSCGTVVSAPKRHDVFGRKWHIDAFSLTIAA